MVRAADVQPGERVLLVGAGEGECLKVLTRDFGAVVTALEWEPAFVAALENRVREDALAGKVTVRQGDLSHAGKSSFEVVIFDSWVPPKDLTAFSDSPPPAAGAERADRLQLPGAGWRKRRGARSGVLDAGVGRSVLSTRNPPDPGGEGRLRASLDRNAERRGALRLLPGARREASGRSKAPRPSGSRGRRRPSICSKTREGANP